jgi:nucleotide-binding universal stress UspA family protein
MWVALGIFVVILFLSFFEFRVRPPDRIILYESKGQVRQRKTRFYPRHFCLAISSSVHTIQPQIDAEAKGRLEIKVRLAISVAASSEHLPDLIRVGGWRPDAVTKATTELESAIDNLVRGFTEKYEVEELSSEKLTENLQDQLKNPTQLFGLRLLSVYVQSIEPVDEEIAEAMRRQEADRIMERTEVLSQKARVAASKAKVAADEEIVLSQHKLEIKRLGLKKIKEEKETDLARIRLEEEMRNRKIQLELDREEVELIKNNPELVLLTPQIARLAEASQNLRNARTVISLSPNDFKEDSPISTLLQSLLERLGKSGQKTRLDTKNRKR